VQLSTVRATHRLRGLPDVEAICGHHLTDKATSAFCPAYAFVALNGCVRYRAAGRNIDHAGPHVVILDAGEFLDAWTMKGTRFQNVFVPANLVREEAEAQGFRHTPCFRKTILSNKASYLSLSVALARLFHAQDTLQQHEELIRLLGAAFCSIDQSGTRLEETSFRAINRIRDALHAGYNRDLTLDNLAAEAGFSKYHAVRSFKRFTGVTPHRYQLHLRVGHAKTLLRGGAEIVYVAHTLGFYDQSHFTNVFRELTGLTPRQYQRGS
jgi:AraC-like DNA-binding protein